MNQKLTINSLKLSNKANDDRIHIGNDTKKEENAIRITGEIKWWTSKDREEMVKSNERLTTGKERELLNKQ